MASALMRPRSESLQSPALVGQLSDFFAGRIKYLTVVASNGTTGWICGTCYKVMGDTGQLFEHRQFHPTPTGDTISRKGLARDNGISSTGPLVAVTDRDLIRGGRSQDAYPGFPCTAMAANFIVFSATRPDSPFTSAFIDKVLYYGNKMYLRCIQGREGYPLLAAYEVAGRFKYENTLCDVTVSEDWFGLIDSDPSWRRSASHFPSCNKLSTAIIEFLQSTASYALLITNNLSMALVKERNYLVFFDSHSRDEYGGVRDLDSEAESGKACILFFAKTNVSECAQNIVCHLIHNLGLLEGEFNLYPVTVDQVNKKQGLRR